MKKNYSSSSRWGFKALSAAVLALAFSATASAQTWDFTKLSDETMANLAAGKEWQDDGEGAFEAAAKFTEAQLLQPVTANGIPVKELDGIVFVNAPDAKQIRLGKQCDGNNPKGTDLIHNTTGAQEGWTRFRLSVEGLTIQLPACQAGDQITIVWQSAKPAVYASGTADTYNRYPKPVNATLTSREPAAPTEDGFETVWPSYQVYTTVYTVNEDIEEPTPIQFTSVGKGIDIYSISISGNGSVEEAKKVAVISPEGEEDPIYFAVQEGFEASFFKTATLADLQEYEAILVSNKVTADSPMASVLREAVAYQPMVNLSAELVKAWGLAEIADSESGIITVSEENLSNAIFAELTYEDGFELLAEGVLPTVKPGDYLKNDAVLATIGDAPYMLQHNAGRNTHILMPLGSEVATDASEVITGLVANALRVAAKSKKGVVPAAQPSFTSVFNNLSTDVTFVGGGDIYYTTDGTEPSDKATPAPAEGVLNFTEATTIKAIAYMDGYTPSAITTYDVEIHAKANMPEISYVQNETTSEITLKSGDEGVTIYYNFTGNTNAERSAKYDGEPIIITEPATIYAFAQGGDYVPSDVAELGIDIKSLNSSNIRLDVAAHFNANHAYWLPADAADRHENATTDSKTYYPWGKSQKWSATEGSTEIIGQVTKTRKVAKKDAEGNDLKDEDGNVIYEMVPAVDENGQPIFNEDGSQKMTEKTEEYVEDVYANNEANLRTIQGLSEGQEDWEVFSYGQLVVFENEKNQKQLAGVANGAVGYYYATAQDEIGSMATSCGLSMKSNSSDGRACAGVQTAKAFAAPFDFVTLFRNNGDAKKPVHMDIYISKDKKNWEKVTTLESSPSLRAAAKYRVPVEKDGEWYVRMMNADNGGGVIADCYIMYNGELSKEYTGIEEIAADEAAEVISVEYYNINGMRIAEPENGFCIMRATLSNGNVVVKKIVK